MTGATKDHRYRLLSCPVYMHHVDLLPFLGFHHSSCIVEGGHAQIVGAVVLNPPQFSVEWLVVPGRGLFENPGTKAPLF